MGPLLSTDRMPVIPGMDVPGQVYCIIRAPPPLAGMRMPSSTMPWATLAQAGLRSERGVGVPKTISFLNSVCATEGPPIYEAL